VRKSVKKVNKNAEQGHDESYKKKKKPKEPEDGNNNHDNKTEKKAHEHKDTAGSKDPNKKKKKPKKPKSGDNNHNKKTKKKPQEQKDPASYMSQHLGSNGVEVEQPKASVVIANHSSIEVDPTGAAGTNEEEEKNEHVPLANLRRSGSTYSRKLSSYSDLLESMMDEDVAGGLVFEDIELEVGRGSHSKKILHKISGQVKPGHILALMGPSGAG
jgi:ABC-type multidrug transport system fused ATPase/permease subunit